ncbi:MAG: glycosyltransferase [Bacteroidia bacterium]|nr:glycosyltransferase [Bacteroidia bacterium]
MNPKFSKKSISIINTHDLTGGASKIAYQLTTNLKNEYKVHYFVSYKTLENNSILPIPKFNYDLIYSLLIKNAKKIGALDLAAFDSINLLKNNLFLESRIVHIHNLYENFFSPLLFNLVLKRKKVIWTLHDEGILTGHCSCTLGCNNWKVGCGDCPDLSIYPKIERDNTRINLKIKKRKINELNPIIVCPSHWLASRVKIAYPMIQKLVVIPNGVDTTIFKPLANKSELRSKFNIPQNKNVILFVAEYSTKNPFKGGDVIRKLIDLVEEESIHFVTVGGNTENKFTNLTSIGYIKNQSELAEIYNACDVLVYPTRADNLPLVILESMSSGVPVIASNIGGISEIITDGVEGYLIEKYMDFNVFLSKLREFFHLPIHQKNNLSENARLKIVSNFSEDQMLEKYKSLYDLCLIDV